MRLSFVSVVRALGLAAMGVGLSVDPAAAQQTFFYSLEGTFNSASEQNFDLILIDQEFADGLAFRTFHHSGGTNAAGDAIPGGSFDPVLELFGSGGVTSFGVNDDFNAPIRDSLLTWPGSPLVTNPVGANTPLNPDPLANGFYSLQLRPFSAPASGDWALDITTDDSIDFTGIETNAGSTITSLKFGYTGAGSTRPRVQNIDLNGPETITGELVVGVIGRGRYEVQLGTTHVGGLTTVNAGSELRAFTNGTFNANGGVLLNGGTLSTETGGVFNLGAGQTLTANNNATITFDANHTVSGGSTYSLNSGSDMDVNGTLDLGDNITGRGEIQVDGSDTSLEAGNVFLGFAGPGSEFRFTNQATGTLGNVTITTDFLTTGSSALVVQSNADVTTGNLTVGTAQSTAATGNLTVSGGGSTLIQNGTATMTVGSADADNFATGHVFVSDSGVLTTGTGTTTINKTGSVFINTGGFFVANGDVVVDGGTFNRNGNFAFDFAAGRTFTARNDAQVNFTGFYFLGENFVIESGADMTVSDAVDIGARESTIGSDASLIVDGPGSTFTNSTTGTNANDWGRDGGAATVTIRNQGTVTIGNGVPLFLAAQTSALDGGETAEVTVESGGQLNVNQLNIASATGIDVTANLDVAGTGSAVNQTGASTLTLGSTGALGTGTINVTDSGTINTGAGTTTINPTGTLNINTGGTFNANGDVNVNGGSITTDDTAFAFNLTPDGTLTATNNAQINFNGPRYTLGVGRTFNILSGSDWVTATGLDIGSGNTGALIVDGAGSTLDVNGGTVFAGFFGGTADVTLRNQASAEFDNIIHLANLSDDSSGTIRVESAATATIHQLLMADDTFGANANATAEVTVTGPGSTITQNGASPLIIGGTGAGSTATLNVTDSGVFNTGTGTTTINNTGTLHVNTNGTFNANGAVNLNGGTINLDGGTLNGGTITDNGGAFNFTGGTLAVETFDGTLDQNGGTLSPGTSPGKTTITGDYHLNAGSVEIEIVDADLLTGDSHDNVEAVGSINLNGGTLALQPTADLPFAIGDGMFLLQADQINGTFNAITGIPLGTVEGFNAGLAVQYFATEVFGRVSILGDANFDDQVNVVDLGILATAWQGSGDWSDADFTGDGLIDLADLGVVADNWLAGAAGPAVAFSEAWASLNSPQLPEPTSFTLIALGGLAATMRRRRR